MPIIAMTTSNTTNVNPLTTRVRRMKLSSSGSDESGLPDFAGK
jgi:hypothetical protein